MNVNRILPQQPAIFPRPFIQPGPQFLLPPPILNQQTQNQTEEPSYDVKPRLSYIFGGVKEGIIRSLLIFFYGLTIICVLAVPRSDILLATYTDLTSTRIAYLIFAVAGLIFSLVMFFMSFFNFANFPLFRKGSWLIILFIFFDSIMLILIFSTAITSAVRESQLSSYGPNVYNAVNRGAFAAAATFGFIVVILLLLSLVIDLFRLTADRYIVIDRKKSNANQNQNNSTNQRF